MNLDLFREKVGLTIESAEHAAVERGFELPGMSVSNRDQFAAAIRDDLNSVGLDPSRPETLYATIGGAMALITLWQEIGGKISVGHVNAYVELCKTLCEMAEGLE